jgi:hypothetical protein
METRKRLISRATGAASALFLLVALAGTARATSYQNSTFTLTVQSPFDTTELITFSGPSQIMDGIGPNGAAQDTGGNGLDDVKIQITSLSMTGTSTTLGFGAGTLNLGQIPPSQGRLEEQSNATPGILDIQPYTPAGSATAFFDVFFELDFPGVTLHNGIGEHVSTTLSLWPPGPGDTFVSGAPIIDLLDNNSNATGYHVIAATYTPGAVPEPSLLELVGLLWVGLSASRRVTRGAEV